MKRLACILALLWNVVAAASDGLRYRVTIDPHGTDDAPTLIRQLASMSRGQVETTSDDATAFVIVASDASMRVLRSDPRVLRVEHIETTATTSWSTGTYSYDGAGNIKKIGTSTFVYDGYGRLTSGMAAGQTQSYTYDRFGNLLTIKTGSTTARLGADPATNRLSLSTLSGQSMNAFGTYDDAGQLTAWNHSGGTFSYDGLGMITTSSGTPDGSNRRYIYTTNDERIVSMEVSGANEISSEWTLRDASGKVLRRLERTKDGSSWNWAWRQDYVYLGSTLLAAEVDTSAKTLHFFPDHLGTPRLITGNGGVQTALHTYFPFGEEATALNQDSERMKFTGHERDASGLDYMHARYYNAGAGRFLSVDPGMDFDAKQPQSWNLYV